jgi:lipopolysaccharide heptosyltransferase II/tetraacyldisaccharide 4'-kinase
LDRGLAGLARVLAVPYAWGAVARRDFYANGWIKKKRLPRPVVSVGNLTVGGTGKTPMVAHLARLLTEKGMKVAILSRGYGGQGKGIIKLSDGKIGNRIIPRPPLVGEEPYWLARNLPGAAVYTGANRYEAGLAAWREVEPDLFLLDDGFQHFQLHRDLDIVLLDAENPFGNGRLLPAGPLREPPETLAAADVIILTRFSGGSQADLYWKLKSDYPRAFLLTADIRPTGARRFPGGRSQDLQALQNLPLFGFCGLARPQVFQDSLEELGVELRGFLSYPDHHTFTASDLNDLVQQARAAGSQGLVTTAKDFARLGEAWDGDLPLWVVDAGVSLEGEGKLVAMILGLLARPPALTSLEAPASHGCGPEPALPLPKEAQARFKTLKVWPSRRPLPPEVGRILLLAPNWLGDAVMSLPVLAGLRSFYPQARLSVAARKSVAPLYEAHPDVTEILVIPQGRTQWSWFRQQRLAFDLAVALPNSLAAAAGLWLARVPERLGYAADGRTWLLTRAVRGRRALAGLHQVYYYLGILSAFGEVSCFVPPRLAVTEQERQAARKMLTARGATPDAPLVGLAPGAAYGPAKRWPPERFAAVAKTLAGEWGALPVILGGPGDRPAAQEVLRRYDGQILDLSGQTSLREALAVLSHIDILITNDSGLMHAAAALDVPLVAIFGSTDPVATGPFSSRALVLRQPLPCSPCFERTCQTGYPCLTAITAAQVLDAAIELRKEKNA